VLEQDWFNPRNVRARQKKFYEEKFTRFTAGLEFVKEPALCNHYGFPVPKDWVENIKRRKKDGLYVVKFKDYAPNRYTMSDENSERIEDQFQEDLKLEGVSNADVKSARWAAIDAAMRPVFDTYWSASYDGNSWYIAAKRKDAVQAAENVPVTERIAWAVSE